MIYLLFLLVLYLIYLCKKEYKIEKYTNIGDIPEFKKPPNWSNLGFNDKLKIYGKKLGKEYSLYADKILVKDYIKNLNITDLYIPKVIKILDPKEDLNLDILPKNCIIKSNCGSGDIIIIKNRKIELMKARNESINDYKKWKNIVIKPLAWRPIVEPHYKYIKPQLFVEEYLGDNIKDYKLFCILGKFIFCQIDSDRYKNHCRNLYDKNYNLLKFSKGVKSCQFKIDKPINYMKMIEISEGISKKFDFCRVDLYEINNKIYFGEITFVPGAAELSDSIRPKKYDMFIGSKWL